MRESYIERQLVRGIHSKGGLCYKFVSPGTPGVPDRLVVTAEGRIIFVELKTETGRLSPMQEWQIGQLRKRGQDCQVLYGMEAVKAFLREVFPDGVQAP